MVDESTNLSSRTLAHSWARPLRRAVEPSKPGDFIETMTQIVRRMRQVKGQAYAALGASVVQAKFLQHLSGNPTASQADVARATGTDPALTGRAVESMLEAGWVTRIRSDADRRQYVLGLTPAGRKLADQVEAVRQDIAGKVMRALDARDLEDFQRITVKTLAALDGD